MCEKGKIQEVLKMSTIIFEKKGQNRTTLIHIHIRMSEIIIGVACAEFRIGECQFEDMSDL